MDQNKLFKALSYLHPDGYEGLDPTKPSPTSYQEFSASLKEGQEVYTEAELEIAYDDAVAEGEERERIELARKTLAEDWESLSDQGMGWIEGPYDDAFTKITNILDKDTAIESRVEMALLVIDGEDCDPKRHIATDANRLAIFNSVKAQFRNRIESLLPEA